MRSALRISLACVLVLGVAFALAPSATAQEEEEEELAQPKEEDGGLGLRGTGRGGGGTGTGTIGIGKIGTQGKGAGKASSGGKGSYGGKKGARRRRAPAKGAPARPRPPGNTRPGLFDDRGAALAPMSPPLSSIYSVRWANGKLRWNLRRSPATRHILIMRHRLEIPRAMTPQYVAAENLKVGGRLGGGWWVQAVLPAQATSVSDLAEEPGVMHVAALAEAPGGYRFLGASEPAPKGGPRSDAPHWSLFDTLSVTPERRTITLRWITNHGSGVTLVLRSAGDETVPKARRLPAIPNEGESLDGWLVIGALAAEDEAFVDIVGAEAAEYRYALALVDSVPTGPVSTTHWLMESRQSDGPVLMPPLLHEATDVKASPIANDNGKHLELTWTGEEQLPSNTQYFVMRSYSSRALAPNQGTDIATYLGSFWLATDGEVEQDGTTYRLRDTVDHRAHYVVATVSWDEARDALTVVWSKSSNRTAPKTALFNTKRWLTAALVILMGLGLAFYIPRVRKNPEKIYIRRIPGVDAIEDAIGRSTEMGRPVLYVTGIEEIQDIQTIASLLVLGPVAEMTAEYDTELKVANFFPLTMVVAEEIVRQSYTNVGRADAHRPENIMFISAEQFAFAAGVNGIILRDKPATNIFLGRFFAESLILAETGYVTKSVQIAGTAEVSQLPFFVAACDYTILGEELYAVSAYLSREPKLLATLKSTDFLKALIIVTIIVGAIAATFVDFNIGPLLAPK